MSGSVSRLQAISAVTNYEPISEPLNFAETPAKALFGVNVFSQAVIEFLCLNFVLIEILYFLQLVLGKLFGAFLLAEKRTT